MRIGTAELRADAPAHLEPVDAGQSDVEHDEPDRVARELRQRLLAAAHPDDAVAVALEVRPHDRPDRLLVLDDEHRSSSRAVAELLGFLARHGFLESPVIRTTVAGWSPSRMVIAFTRTGTAIIDDSRPLAQISTPGASGIVCRVPSRSSS